MVRAALLALTFLTLATLAAGCAASRGDDGDSPGDEHVLTLRPPAQLRGVGTIVLVSGDEEYRSEEALAQLGAILAARHGFTCHVLFAIDPATGEINPDIRTNIPGLHLLEDADLMIIATRFRELPDEQMRWIDAYVRSERPILGLRTATHAFNGGGTYAHYAWDHAGPTWPGGFGRAILGETWIAHHGAHGRESTEGVVEPLAADHPILRGIADGDAWGPTDVYRVRLPLPEDCRILLRGRILSGMSPDDPPVDDGRNQPMMPIAWTREMPLDDGGVRRVFTSTMGAATDLDAEGTRRVLVHAAYWLLQREHQIPPGGADVRLVGTYQPTAFGFGGFRRGVRPADLAPAGGHP